MSTPESYYFVKDKKVYLKRFLDFPDREIGEVLEDEKKSIQYFIDRFSRVTKSICDLEEKISSATNKGSFLMKVVHMKDQMSKYKAIGDFESIIRRLETIEGELQNSVVESRVKNLEVKKTLLKELQLILSREDWFKDTNRVKEIQAEWVRTGRVEEEEEAVIEPEFQNILNSFFDQRKEQAAIRNELIQIRKEKYEELIAKGRWYFEQDNIANFVDDYKELQKTWKAIGHIPKPVLEPLWEAFQSVSNAFFEKLKSSNERKKKDQEDQSKGLSGKKQAFMALEGLEKEDRPSMSRLKSIQKRWRSAGFVEPSLLGSLGDDFSLKCQVIVEKNFVGKILFSKHDGFSERSEKEQAQLKRELLSQLIQRDELELQRMQENIEMFGASANKNSQNPINDRLQDHLRKLNAKKQILSSIGS